MNRVIWSPRSNRQEHDVCVPARIQQARDRAAYLMHRIGNTMQASVNLVYLSNFYRRLRQMRHHLR